MSNYYRVDHTHTYLCMKNDNISIIIDSRIDVKLGLGAYFLLEITTLGNLKTSIMIFKNDKFDFRFVKNKKR